MEEQGSSTIDERYKLMQKVLYDKTKGTPHYKDESGMPYEGGEELQKPIGKGAYGVVYKVRIFGGHLFSENGKSSYAR